VGRLAEAGQAIEVAIVDDRRTHFGNRNGDVVLRISV
jgi:hypothetical protein